MKEEVIYLWNPNIIIFFRSAGGRLTLWLSFIFPFAPPAVFLFKLLFRFWLFLWPQELLLSSFCPLTIS